MATITASRTIDRPAPEVWAVVADYDLDPRWRQGVETMAPRPTGLVTTSTTTAEVLHFGRRTYENAGEVTRVEPGSHFEWRTTKGADADGSRTVRAIDDRRCEVTLVLNVRAHGLERLMQPVLVGMLRRGMKGDLGRLAALVESAPASDLTTA